ncbi:hypothetical protein CBL_05506 [Carabus blaptoides fortunei]
MTESAEFMRRKEAKTRGEKCRVILCEMEFEIFETPEWCKNTLPRHRRGLEKRRFLFIALTEKKTQGDKRLVWNEKASAWGITIGAVGRTAQLNWRDTQQLSPRRSFSFLSFAELQE